MSEMSLYPPQHDTGVQLSANPLLEGPATASDVALTDNGVSVDLGVGVGATSNEELNEGGSFEEINPELVPDGVPQAAISCTSCRHTLCLSDAGGRARFVGEAR